MPNICPYLIVIYVCKYVLKFAEDMCVSCHMTENDQNLTAFIPC